MLFSPFLLVRVFGFKPAILNYTALSAELCV